MSTAAVKMITLQTFDKEKFEVDEKVATESLTIKHMIEDDCADSTIPLPNVTSKILAKVIEYCKKHAASNEEDKEKKKNPSSSSSDAADDSLKKHVEESEEDNKEKKNPSSSSVADDSLKTWDAEFIQVDDLSTLLDIMLAANYLNIKSLLDLTCQTVADMIKGKTPEEIREALNIKNDFTPEEEAGIRKENQWAFEG